MIVNSRTGGAGSHIREGCDGADRHPAQRGVGACAPYGFTPVDPVVLAR